MSFLFAVFAIICGVALALGIDTGKLDKDALAGVGIVLAALAAMAPPDLSWLRRP